MTGVQTCALPIFNAEPDAIRGMVGAAEIEAEAEASDQIFFSVGDSLALVVMVSREIRRMHDVKRARALVPCHPARTVHLGEGAELVRLAIAIGIAGHDHATAPGLTVERPILVAPNEHRAIRARADKNGIGNLRRRGEHRGFKAGRHGDALLATSGRTGNWSHSL